jgi:protein-disulfide isomerase
VRHARLGTGPHRVPKTKWNLRAKNATARAALPTASRVAILWAGAIGLTASSGCRDSSASGGATAAPSVETAQAAAQAEPTLPGVDVSAMTPRERREWGSLVRELLAPCPTVPVSVAQCVQEARLCSACLQAAKWIAMAVRDGASGEQVRRAYTLRFDPSGVRTLPIDGSPTMGPENASVTLVEFADFECPHCREAVPLIDAVLAAHPGKVRLVYKSYTLPSHVHGEPAARAAFAAALQGRFWEMEHILFERQEHLEDQDLDRYAHVLRLDVVKWKADTAAPAVKDRVIHDHSLGEQLKLKGTPTIYINGRELDAEHDESLEARVAAELGETQGSSAPIPASAGTPSSNTPSTAGSSKPK